MDVSKLPKFSQTPAPPPADPGSTLTGEPLGYQTPPAPVATVLSGSGPEAWIGVGLGLILILVFPEFVRWLIYVVFHTAPPSFLPITDASGQEIPYQKSDFFLPHLCITLFAFALMLEGIVLLLARSARWVWLALVITSAAVALNLFYVIYSFATGQGFALVSGVAVLVGGYMAMYQWRLIHGCRQLGIVTRSGAK